MEASLRNGTCTKCFVFIRVSALFVKVQPPAPPIIYFPDSPIIFLLLEYFHHLFCLVIISYYLFPLFHYSLRMKDFHEGRGLPCSRDSRAQMPGRCFPLSQSIKCPFPLVPAACFSGGLPWPKFLGRARIHMSLSMMVGTGGNWGGAMGSTLIQLAQMQRAYFYIV